MPSIFDFYAGGQHYVYVTNSGDNWVRPTDKNGVLLDKPKMQHNSLFMNIGNDENGDPLYKQVSVLSKENDTYVEEELLRQIADLKKESVAGEKGFFGKSKNTANVSFVCRDVADYLNFNPLEPKSLILLDPPRNGLDKATIQPLLDAKPSSFVYISFCQLSRLIR